MFFSHYPQSIRRYPYRYHAVYPLKVRCNGYSQLWPDRCLRPARFSLHSHQILLSQDSVATVLQQSNQRWCGLFAEDFCDLPTQSQPGVEFSKILKLGCRCKQPLTDIAHLVFNLAFFAARFRCTGHRPKQIVISQGQEAAIELTFLADKNSIDDGFQVVIRLVWLKKQLIQFSLE